MSDMSPAPDWREKVVTPLVQVDTSATDVSVSHDAMRAVALESYDLEYTRVYDSEGRRVVLAPTSDYEARVVRVEESKNHRQDLYVFLIDMVRAIDRSTGDRRLYEQTSLMDLIERIEEAGYAI